MTTPRLSRQGSALLDISGLNAPPSARGFSSSARLSSRGGPTPRDAPGSTQTMRLRSARSSRVPRNVPRLPLRRVPEAGPPAPQHPASNALVVARPARKDGSHGGPRGGVLPSDRKRKDPSCGSARRFSQSGAHLFSVAEASALLSAKLAAHGTQLRKVFRTLDEDSGGGVALEELRSFMARKFQLRMADDEFAALMRGVGSGPEGELSFADFQKRWGQDFQATESGGTGHMLQNRRNSNAAYAANSKHMGDNADTTGGKALALMPLAAAKEALHVKLGEAGTDARRIFRQLDEDKSGHISKGELRTIMKDRFNIAVSDADFAALCATVDHDASGDITIKEFVAAFGGEFGYDGDGAGGITDTLFTNVNENDAYLAARAELEESRAAARKGLTAEEADTLFKEKMRTYVN